MLLFIYSIHLRHEFIHERFVIVNLWTIGVEFVSKFLIFHICLICLISFLDARGHVRGSLSPFLLPRS